jgi:hypothetical protein
MLSGPHPQSLAAMVEVQASHLPGLLVAYGPVMAHYQRAIKEHMEQQRRHVMLQAMVAIHVACLVLPLVSAPLGGVVAAACSWRIVSKARARLERQRNRLWYWQQPVRPLLLNLACAVLRTLRASKGLTRAQLPSSGVRIARTESGGFRIWLEGRKGGAACGVAFAQALSDALGLVDGHRFAIRPPAAEGCVMDYPVPHCFGQTRRLARVYGVNWWRIFGVGQLICLRDVDTGLLSAVEDFDAPQPVLREGAGGLVFRPSLWGAARATT